MTIQNIKEAIHFWQAFTIQKIKANHDMESGPRFLRTRPGGEIELIIIPRYVYEHLDSFLLSEEEAQKVWEMTNKKI